jgi:Tol biopolymer transport system component
MSAPATDAKTRTSTKRRAKAALAISPSKTTLASLSNKILFQQNNDLWAIHPDGTGKIRVLAKPFGGSFISEGVSWSPDRSRVAFLYDRPNDDPYASEELFVARLDGTSRRQLTNRAYADGLAEPQWSPDGKKILYTRWTGKHWGGPMQADADIWVINADGSGHRRVIGDYLKRDATHSSARWSRDGKRIFFLRTEGDIYEGSDVPPPPFVPWSCALDGSDAQPLENNWGDFALPEVSPDGKFRLEVSKYDEQKREWTPLLLHDLASGEKRALTDDARTQFLRVRWRPGGEEVAVEWSHSLSINGQYQVLRGIDLVLRDGTQRRRLISDASLLDWLK